MIRLTPYLSAFVALAMTFAYVLPNVGSESEMQDLVLPVEVMHYDVFGEHAGNSELPIYGSDSPRYVKSVTFDVSGSPGELWLWGHQIGFQYFWDHFEWQQGAGDIIGATITSDYDAPYDGRAKASVRINGGSWIDITNDNVTCADMEEKQFCIGGIAGSTRFKVNGSQLQEGSNTVELAFLGHDMLSSGYRILDIVALPAGYSGSLSHRDVRPVDLITNNKVMDYLDTEAPEGADASAGEALWHADNSLLDFPGGPEIIASCNDCHAQDGRDLEFFGYSNESITVRSMHHGLTEQEGENIAAFIRSQDLTLEDGTSYSFRSRPWHPPYQPGPRGFGPNDEHPDVADAQFWAGGAGLEWVADSDMETVPYLFSDGTGNPDAGPFVEPPDIAIQSSIFRVGSEESLNLREIPIDTQLPDWNRWLPIIHPRDAIGDEIFFNPPNGGYPNYLDARNSEGSINDIHQMIWRSRSSYRNANIIGENTAWNRAESRYKRAERQWISVKAWEIHHEFFVEDRSGDANRPPRSWVVETRPVFDIASHIAGNQSTLDGPPVGKAGEGLSHLWYHSQLILSAEEAQATSQSPIDWNYQEGFLREHASATGLPSTTRTMTTIAKKDQLLGGKFGLDEGQGFNNHRHGLREIFRPANSVAFSSLEPSLRNEIVGSYLSAWAWFVHQWDIADFPRADGSGGGRDRNSWGMPEDRPQANGVTSHGTNTAARNHYNSIIWFDNNLNISPTTLDSLARWGSEMWSEPQEGNPGWDTWFLENVPAFGLNMAGGSNQVAPASVTLTAEPDGTPDEVRFFQNDVLIDTRTGPPWETAVSDLSEGTYTFRAESQIGQDVFESGQRTLGVDAAWVRENLNPRARGAVTGALNLLPDHIQLEATGTDSGMRRKTDLQQFEAVETCRLDEEWEFSFTDVTGNAGPWSRVGIQVENTGSFANAVPDAPERTGEGFEMWSAEYLPLQRRMRVLYADPDRAWFSQEHSRISISTPVQGRVSIEDAGPVANIRLEYDSTGDGAFDRNLTYTLDTLIDDCEISLVATSRRSGQQIEALFTLEKVE